MAKQSYLVRTQFTITIQEGDTGSIPFIVPALFDMTGKDIIFEVEDEDGISVFKKQLDSAETEIELALDDSSGQLFYVLLDGEESKGHAATNHSWELQAYDDEEINTIGKGTFVIQSEIIDEGIGE